MFDGWGLGPVFKYEWVGTSRRWQYYAGRCVFIGLLLSAFTLVWIAEHDSNPNLNLRTMATVGVKFFYALVGTQITLVLLAVPAVTASTLCLDKANGTLMHLFATDLSNWEIVQGKLAARMISIFGFVLSGLPVMFVGTLIGGIDPGALVGAFLVSLGAAIFGGTLAIALSVWCSRTYEVLMITYLIWAAILLGGPIIRHLTPWTPPFWLEMTNPYWLAFAPYNNPGMTTLGVCGTYLGWSIVLSFVMLAVAAFMVRKVAIKQSHQPIKERRRRWRKWRLLFWLPGPSLDGNPVLWYEWQRKKPSRWVQAVWFVYGFFAVIFTGLAVYRSLQAAFGAGRGNEMNAFINAFMVSVGLLFASVLSVTALTDERIRGSLDVLLTTPLSSTKIVWGKWWGAYRTVIILAILPSVIFFFGCITVGRVQMAWAMPMLVLSYGAAFTSLGLALAVWIRKPGRALALSVVFYVLSNVVWIFLMILFSIRGETPIPSGSPWFGAGWLTAEFERSYSHNDAALWGAIIWSVVYSIFAVVLGIATLLSFDSCMGRIRTSLQSAIIGDRYRTLQRPVRASATPDLQAGEALP